MKAWKVYDEQSYEGGSTVVFAETRGKAKVLAQMTDSCEDAEYTDIRATRMPELDGYKDHECEMDWYDENDRIALVKLGWSCLEPEDDVCMVAPCREFCVRWEDEVFDR